MTNTFDIQAAEKRYERWAAENPATYGTPEGRRAWHLIGRLLTDLGATRDQQDWACGLMVSAETAEFSRGFQAGFKAGAA